MTEDLLTFGALEVDLDLADGAMEDERPLEDLVVAKTCAIVLLSTGCLDFDRALLLLAIERDLPLDDEGKTEGSSRALPRPRA